MISWLSIYSTWDPVLVLQTALISENVLTDFKAEKPKLDLFCFELLGSENMIYKSLGRIFVENLTNKSPCPISCSNSLAESQLGCWLQMQRDVISNSDGFYQEQEKK